MPPTLSTVKDAIGAALAPYFPADDPVPELAEDLALTDADDELRPLLLAEGMKPKMVVGKLKGKATTTVQTIIFPKSDYPSVDACKAWLERNGLSAGKVDETGDSYRYRQREPGDFEPGSFRTITPGERKATEPDNLALAESAHTQEFLSDFRRRVLDAAKDGDLTEDVLLACMRGARGYAGGKTAAKNRALAASDDTALTEGLALTEPFVLGMELGEVGKAIQIMRAGEFKNHPVYGDFAITQRDMEEIVRKFRENVRGQDIPIDINHEGPEGGPAVGWIKDLELKDGELWATPEWTDQGAELVGSGAYRYFSPHYGPYEDKESGEKHRSVLLSGAITNFPFLKNMEPIALSEFTSRKEHAVSANVEDLEKQLTEARETAAKAEETAAQAKADAEAREKALTEAQEREKSLAERVQRMERDGMVRRLTERVRGNGDPTKRIIGDEDQIVTHIVKLAETFGEESDEVKFALQREEQHSTALRASGALDEHGSTQGGAAGDAEQEFKAKLREVMATNPALNEGEASSKVLSEHPEIYRRYAAARPRGAPRN